MADIDPVQLDIACTVARIEQAWAERGTALGDLLLMRLVTCDAQRLRGHLTPEGRALLASEAAIGVEAWRTVLTQAIETLAPG